MKILSLSSTLVRDIPQTEDTLGLFMACHEGQKNESDRIFLMNDRLRALRKTLLYNYSLIQLLKREYSVIPSFIGMALQR